MIDTSRRLFSEPRAARPDTERRSRFATQLGPAHGPVRLRRPRYRRGRSFTEHTSAPACRSRDLFQAQTESPSRPSTGLPEFGKNAHSIPRSSSMVPTRWRSSAPRRTRHHPTSTRRYFHPSTSPKRGQRKHIYARKPSPSMCPAAKRVIEAGRKWARMAAVPSASSLRHATTSSSAARVKQASGLSRLRPGALYAGAIARPSGPNACPRAPSAQLDLRQGAFGRHHRRAEYPPRRLNNFILGPHP